MSTWKELEQEFRRLAPNLEAHRIEYRWGAQGESHEIVGPASLACTRFESLATLAGEKLTESFADDLPVEVLVQHGAAAGWYEALRLRSGMFTSGDTVVQMTAAGVPRGALHTGAVHRPAEASAIVANIFAELAAQRVPRQVTIMRPPALGPGRPWWRSWGVLLIAATGVIAMILALLPQHTPRAPAPSASSASNAAPDSSVDETTVEIHAGKP